MCTELHGRRFWLQTVCLVPSVTVAIYFGELGFATTLAVVLLTISISKSSIVLILFCCGLLTFTLAEYITHRFVLHALAPLQHGIHHARPREPIDRIFWQIWLAFIVVYLTTGGALLAGALVLVNQDDIASPLLQVQGRADADHACAQYENIGLEFRHLSLRKLDVTHSLPLPTVKLLCRLCRANRHGLYGNRACAAAKLWQHGSANLSILQK